MEAALKKRSFYELLNSQEGFLTLQGYFIKAALLLDRDNGVMQGSPAAGGGNANIGAGFDLNNGGFTDASRTQTQFASAYFQQNSLGTATPIGLGGSSGGRAMLGALGKGLGAGQNANLLSTGGGAGANPLYSSFMVEVDEFKFSKIISNVVQKSHETLLDDEMSGMSEEETELSGDEEGSKSDGESRSDTEHRQNQQFQELSWLQS